MNPSPDRGKECLPPKKRESRQGSTEHHVTLEFKPPVPLRSRPGAGGGEGGRRASDKERSPLNPSPQLLHTPPPLPVAPPGLHLPLPWHLSYSPSVSLPLFQGPLGERRGSGSPAWRDDPLLSPLTHHSQWFRGEAALSLPPSPSSSSSSSFKTPFPADCREMGSYINSGRHDNSSSLFSPSYTFSHNPFCSQDPSLLDVRHRYLVKRPNGLDGPGSRTASTSRTLITGEYGNDSSRTRLDASPHGSQSNGGRRQQEDPTSRLHSGGVFFSDCQALEGPEPHSSQQDRQIHGISKSSSSLIPTRPHPIGLVPRAGRGSLLDPLGVTPAEAQIYYSLGSVCQPSPQAQAYPLFNPSGTPLYNLHREQGPRLHSQRNSPNSPLGLPNNHDRLQRDKDRDKVPQRDEERDADKRSNLLEHKDQDQHSDQHRRQERERDRGRELSPSHTSPLGLHPPPPPLLPHFTKGSLIELASGRLKRVEELQTEDFLRSADTSPEFHLSSCTVLLIYPSVVQGFSHLQVHLTDLNTQEYLKVLVEYPFFVQDRGWSSCCPQRTLQLYGLPCRQLTEGDVCLALTPTPTQTHRTQTRPSSRAHRTQLSSRGSSSSHREEMPPPPPPPPLPHHTPATVPAPPPTTEPPVRREPRPRKRRWSAPDGLSPTRTDALGLLDLPHGSKLTKWQ